MDDIRLSDLRDSWKRHLMAANKTPGTVRVYLTALDKLIATTGDQALEQVTHATLERFISDGLERLKPATVSIDYRALQQFFKWAEGEGEIDKNPMARMKPPMVPLNPPPVLRENDIAKLLAACTGRDFNSRRDHAVIRVFLSNGMRLGELTGMRVEDLSVPDRRIIIRGHTSKGRTDRTVAIDLRAANAVDAYLRIRRRHRLADLPELWLGNMGPLTTNGMYQVIRRRAKSVGLTINPHLFRHTFAHEWMAAGGGESDLQTLAGWKSAQMLRRYGASAANERALSAYDRVRARTPDR